jgi:hypothetical protein
VVDINKPISFMTIEDVAELIDVHVNTSKRWSDRSVTKSYRINTCGHRMFSQDDIASFISNYANFNNNKTRLVIRDEKKLVS